MSEPENTSVPLSPKFNDLRDHYAIFRDYMKHEDDLINHRTTWHGVTQGLLFTSFGALLQWKPDLKVMDDFLSVRATMSYLVPVIGILIAIIGFMSCWAANRAINTLSDQWAPVSDLYDKPLPRLPGIAGGGSLWAKRLGKTPSLFIPLIMGTVWVWLFVVVWRAHPYAHLPKPNNDAAQVAASAEIVKSHDEIIREINDSLHHLDELEAQLQRDGIAPQPRPVHKSLANNRQPSPHH